MNTETPLVSIIIPIYGVEAYIEQCARSLFEQTLDNIEFIFVNDATPDNSIAILEKVIAQYTKRKNQIKILNHTENKGLPQARKTGIENAKGKYIGNCDSDDYVDKTMYQTLVEQAETQNCDIILNNYYLVYNSHIKTVNYFQKPYKNNKEYIDAIMKFNAEHSIAMGIVSSKLYKNILFPTDNMGEDLVIITQLINQASKIGYNQKYLYYYRQHTNSMMGNQNLQKNINQYIQLKRNIDRIIDYIQQNQLDPIYTISVKLHTTIMLYYKIRNKKALKQLATNTYTDINIKTLFNKQIPLYPKIQYILVKLKLSWLIDLKNKCLTILGV